MNKLIKLFSLAFVGLALIACAEKDELLDTGDTWDDNTITFTFSDHSITASKSSDMYKIDGTKYRKAAR